MSQIPNQPPMDVGQRLAQATMQSGLGQMTDVQPFVEGEGAGYYLILGPVMMLLGLLGLWLVWHDMHVDGVLHIGWIFISGLCVLLGPAMVWMGVHTHRRGQGWIGFAPAGAVVTHDKQQGIVVLPFQATHVQPTFHTNRGGAKVERLTATFTNHNGEKVELEATGRKHQDDFNRVLTRFPGQAPMQFI